MRSLNGEPNDGIPVGIYDRDRLLHSCACRDLPCGQEQGIEVNMRVNFNAEIQALLEMPPTRRETRAVEIQMAIRRELMQYGPLDVFSSLVEALGEWGRPATMHVNSRGQLEGYITF